MKKVITYGTYDLLHQGHINLLSRARALGDYLIVGVTNDNFDRERGKLNVRNNVLERIEAVKATGLADQIVIEDYMGQKIDDILKDAAEVSFSLRSVNVAVVDFVEVAPDSGDRTVLCVSVDVGAAEGGETDVFDKLAVAQKVSEGIGNKHA